MRGYLEFVDAYYWNKNVRYGVFKYDGIYIFKFYIKKGPYNYYFVANTSREYIDNVFESKKLSEMKKEDIIKFFGEEFYVRYKSDKLTIKYLQKIEKTKTAKIRRKLAKLEDNKIDENLL